MAHEATESIAINPHNLEAARTTALFPEYLREIVSEGDNSDSAISLVGLLTDYYNYLNGTGFVSKLKIVDGGVGFGEDDAFTVSGGNGKNLNVSIVVVNGVVSTVNIIDPGQDYLVDDEIRLISSNSVAVLKVIELRSGASNITERIVEEHDIDKTSLDYLQEIQKEIARDVPQAKSLDRRALYKKITKYYQTRGSQDSIFNFFKIFYDEIISLFYPKEFLMKLSEGEFISEGQTVGRYDADENGDLIVDSDNPNVSDSTLKYSFKNFFTNEIGDLQISNDYSFTPISGFNNTYWESELYAGFQSEQQKLYLQYFQSDKVWVMYYDRMPDASYLDFTYLDETGAEVTFRNNPAPFKNVIAWCYSDDNTFPPTNTTGSIASSSEDNTRDANSFWTCPSRGEFGAVLDGGDAVNSRLIDFNKAPIICTDYGYDFNFNTEFQQWEISWSNPKYSYLGRPITVDFIKNIKPVGRFSGYNVGGSSWLDNGGGQVTRGGVTVVQAGTSSEPYGSDYYQISDFNLGVGLENVGVNNLNINAYYGGPPQEIRISQQGIAGFNDRIMTTMSRSGNNYPQFDAIRNNLNTYGVTIKNSIAFSGDYTYNFSKGYFVRPFDEDGSSGDNTAGNRPNPRIVLESGTWKLQARSFSFTDNSFGNSFVDYYTSVANSGDTIISTPLENISWTAVSAYYSAGHLGTSSRFTPVVTKAGQFSTVDSERINFSKATDVPQAPYTGREKYYIFPVDSIPNFIQNTSKSQILDGSPNLYELRAKVAFNGTQTNSVLYKNSLTSNAPQQIINLGNGFGSTTLKLEAGKLYTSNTNFSIYESDSPHNYNSPRTQALVMPYSFAGKLFGSATKLERQDGSGNKTKQRFLVHAIEENTTVRFFDGTDITTSAPTSTVVLGRGQDHVFSSSVVGGKTGTRPGIGYIKSDKNICVSTMDVADNSPQNTFNRMVLAPADNRMIVRNASDSPLAQKSFDIAFGEKGRQSANDYKIGIRRTQFPVSDSPNGSREFKGVYVTNTDSPNGSAFVVDSADDNRVFSIDAAAGIGVKNLKDTYLVPHPLRDYCLITPYEDNNITVKYLSEVSKGETNTTQLKTYRSHLLDGSIDQPVGIQWTGKAKDPLFASASSPSVLDSGTALKLTGDSPNHFPKLWVFEGRRPFSFTTNTARNEETRAGFNRNKYNLSYTNNVPEYANIKSQISNENRLTDLNFWQEFSYEIRTQLSGNLWENEFEKFVHPAGLKYFTRLVIESFSQRNDGGVPIRYTFNSPDTLDSTRPEWITKLFSDNNHTPLYQPGVIDLVFKTVVESIIAKLQISELGTLGLNNESYSFDTGLRLSQPTLKDIRDDSTGEYTARKMVSGTADQFVIRWDNSIYPNHTKYYSDPIYITRTPRDTKTEAHIANQITLDDDKIYAWPLDKEIEVSFFLSAESVDENGLNLQLCSGDGKQVFNVTTGYNSHKIYYNSKFYNSNTPSVYLFFKRLPISGQVEKEYSYKVEKLKVNILEKRIDYLDTSFGEKYSSPDMKGFKSNYDVLEPTDNGTKIKVDNSQSTEHIVYKEYGDLELNKSYTLSLDFSPTANNIAARSLTVYSEGHKEDSPNSLNWLGATSSVLTGAGSLTYQFTPKSEEDKKLILETPASLTKFATFSGRAKSFIKIGNSTTSTNAYGNAEIPINKDILYQYRIGLRSSPNYRWASPRSWDNSGIQTPGGTNNLNASPYIADINTGFNGRTGIDNNYNGILMEYDFSHNQNNLAFENNTAAGDSITYTKGTRSTARTLKTPFVNVAQMLEANGGKIRIVNQSGNDMTVAFVGHDGHRPGSIRTKTYFTPPHGAPSNLGTRINDWNTTSMQGGAVNHLARKVRYLVMFKVATGSSGKIYVENDDEARKAHKGTAIGDSFVSVDVTNSTGADKVFKLEFYGYREQFIFFVKDQNSDITINYIRIISTSRRMVAKALPFGERVYYNSSKWTDDRTGVESDSRGVKFYSEADFLSSQGKSFLHLHQDLLNVTEASDKTFYPQKNFQPWSQEPSQTRYYFEDNKENTSNASVDGYNILHTAEFSTTPNSLLAHREIQFDKENYLRQPNDVTGETNPQDTSYPRIYTLASQFESRNSPYDTLSYSPTRMIPNDSFSALTSASISYGSARKNSPNRLINSPDNIPGWELDSVNHPSLEVMYGPYGFFRFGAKNVDNPTNGPGEYDSPTDYNIDLGIDVKDVTHYQIKYQAYDNPNRNEIASLRTPQQYPIPFVSDHSDANPPPATHYTRTSNHNTTLVKDAGSSHYGQLFISGARRIAFPSAWDTLYKGIDINGTNYQTWAPKVFTEGPQTVLYDFKGGTISDASPAKPYITISAGSDENNIFNTVGVVQKFFDYKNMFMRNDTPAFDISTDGIAPNSTYANTSTSHFKLFPSAGGHKVLDFYWIKLFNGKTLKAHIVATEGGYFDLVSRTFKTGSNPHTKNASPNDYLHASQGRSKHGGTIHPRAHFFKLSNLRVLKPRERANTNDNFDFKLKVKGKSNLPVRPNTFYKIEIDSTHDYKDGLISGENGTVNLLWNDTQNMIPKPESGKQAFNLGHTHKAVSQYIRNKGLSLDGCYINPIPTASQTVGTIIESDILNGPRETYKISDGQPSALNVSLPHGVERSGQVTDNNIFAQFSTIAISKKYSAITLCPDSPNLVSSHGDGLAAPFVNCGGTGGDASPYLYPQEILLNKISMTEVPGVINVDAGVAHFFRPNVDGSIGGVLDFVFQFDSEQNDDLSNLPNHIGIQAGQRYFLSYEITERDSTKTNELHLYGWHGYDGSRESLINLTNNTNDASIGPILPTTVGRHTILVTAPTRSNILNGSIILDELKNSLRLRSSRGTCNFKITNVGLRKAWTYTHEFRLDMPNSPHRTADLRIQNSKYALGLIGFEGAYSSGSLYTEDQAWFDNSLDIETHNTFPLIALQFNKQSGFGYRSNYLQGEETLLSHSAASRSNSSPIITSRHNAGAYYYGKSLPLGTYASPKDNIFDGSPAWIRLKTEPYTDYVAPTSPNGFDVNREDFIDSPASTTNTTQESGLYRTTGAPIYSQSFYYTKNETGFTADTSASPLVTDEPHLGTIVRYYRNRYQIEWGTVIKSGVYQQQEPDPKSMFIGNAIGYGAMGGGATGPWENNIYVYRRYLDNKLDLEYNFSSAEDQTIFDTSKTGVSKNGDLSSLLQRGSAVNNDTFILSNIMLTQDTINAKDKPGSDIIDNTLSDGRATTEVKVVDLGKINFSPHNNPNHASPNWIETTASPNWGVSKMYRRTEPMNVRLNVEGVYQDVFLEYENDPNDAQYTPNQISKHTPTNGSITINQEVVHWDNLIQNVSNTIGDYPFIVNTDSVELNAYEKIHGDRGPADYTRRNFSPA